MPTRSPLPTPTVDVARGDGSIYVRYQPARTREEAGVTVETILTNVNIERDSDDNLYAIEYLSCIGRFFTQPEPPPAER